MASLVIEIDATQVEDLMTAVEGALNVENVLDTAASIILNRTRSRFMQELNPEGEPWIPSAAGVKRRQHGGTGTLRDTETLWRSIQLAPHTGDLFGDVGERVINAGAWSKGGVEYGHFHQFGLGQEKREFLGIPLSDIELFEHRILQKVAEALGV